MCIYVNREKHGEAIQDRAKEGPEKKAHENSRKPKLNVRATTGARHLHPSDNTPITPACEPDGGKETVGREGSTRSNEEGRIGGFLPLAALAAGLCYKVGIGWLA